MNILTLINRKWHPVRAFHTLRDTGFRQSCSAREPNGFLTNGKLVWHKCHTRFAQTPNPCHRPTRPHHDFHRSVRGIFFFHPVPDQVITITIHLQSLVLQAFTGERHFRHHRRKTDASPSAESLSFTTYVCISTH